MSVICLEGMPGIAFEKLCESRIVDIRVFANDRIDISPVITSCLLYTSDAADE